MCFLQLLSMQHQPERVDLSATNQSTDGQQQRDATPPATDEGMAAAIARIERKLRIDDAPEVALGCLKKDGRFRAFLLQAVTWPGTDWFILMLVLINAVALASEDPTQPTTAGSSRIILLLNTGLNGAFTIEMVAKIFAFGVWGKGSYFGDGWNCMDAAIVVLGYAAFTPKFGQYTALRFLRILRWLYKISGTRLVLMACYSSLPGLRSVLILNVLTLLVSRMQYPFNVSSKTCPISPDAQVFALIALELWSGVMNGVCGYTDPNTGFWTWDSAEAPCGLPCDGACVVSFGDSCGFASGVFSATNGSLLAIQMQVRVLRAACPSRCCGKR